MIALALVLLVVAADPQPNPLVARVEALRALKNKGWSKELATTGAKLREDLTAAARAQPSAETLVLLGRAQLYLEENEAAALSFDEAIKLNPREADAQFYRGFVARQLDALEPAVGFFRKAAELDPKSARNQAELGAALAALDKLDEAIVALKKAVALDPKDEFALSLAGRLLIESGKSAEGIVLLEKALVIEPRDTLAAYNAALHYQQRQTQTLARVVRERREGRPR